MRNTSFKNNPIYLLPIIMSLFTGVLFTLVFLLSPIEPLPIVIGSEEGFGPLLNSFFFVVMTCFGATLIYLLLKRKKFRLINILVGLTFSFVIFFLSFLYLSMVFVIFDLPPFGLDLWVLILSCFLSGIGLFGIFGKWKVFHEIIVIILGGALGSFLGASIPTLSAISILVFLAVYDMFAVYRGPVGKLAMEGLEKLHGLSFSFKDVQVGLGDLVFYSMLVDHVMINFGLKSCIGAFIGISLGSFLSFKMLEREGMFPGLPFSVGLGLLGAYLGSVG